MQTVTPPPFKPPRSPPANLCTALAMKDETYLETLQAGRFPSPCFVLDDMALRRNAAVLDEVQRRTGAKILLALKGFAMWDAFPLLSRDPVGSAGAGGPGPLHGCCASSPDEARLARECFGGEVHAFAAAYSERDVHDLLAVVNHLLFNSFAQWQRFRPLVDAHNREAAACGGRVVRCGLRVNPEHSEGAVDIYNPCSPASRLGVRQAAFDAALARGELAGLSGLHFHTLCEQGADALERTLAAFEQRFGHVLHGLDWLNMGGGHHITRPGYDLDLLCRCIRHVQATYGVSVYLEPGEAVALNAGVLVSTVLDVVEADLPVVILDTSASAHMPDVLEMPYRPHVLGSGLPGDKAWTCRLAGKSCLAGDTIGEYAFDAPLSPGDRLVFTDMAIYSMVKTTTFNGLRLPSIARWNAETDTIRVVKTFGYDDFKNRLS